jgi:hypothetical protein
MSPEDVHTPGIFVNKVVLVARHPKQVEIGSTGRPK